MKKAAFAIGLALLLASAAKANVVALDDSKAVLLLWKKAMDLSGGLSQVTQATARNGSSAAGLNDAAGIAGIALCLYRLQVAAASMSELTHVAAMNLLNVASMKDPRDEELSLEVARSSLRNVGAQIELHRHTTNSIQASCPHSATVNVKARTLLNILNEAARTLEPIAHKIGAD